MLKCAGLIASTKVAPKEGHRALNHGGKLQRGN